MTEAAQTLQANSDRITTIKQQATKAATQHHKRGMTMILVTHDAELAKRCHRQLTLQTGRIQ